MVKQFISESDEAWADQIERLATTIEGPGRVKSTGEEMRNNYVLESDASRHSEAIDRHEEHLNMIRPAARIFDAVWSTLTQPVASVEAAMLKLRSVKQKNLRFTSLKLRWIQSRRVSRIQGHRS